MAAATASVERLPEAVKQLSPDEFAESTSRLAEWQGPGGAREASDSRLIRQTQPWLPADEAKRLRALTRQSEQETLRPPKLDEYGRLAEQAERTNALRVEALAELARRRSQSVDRVKQDIGRKERHGA